jgi:hypothetical protein
MSSTSSTTVIEHECWVRLPHRQLRLRYPAVYLPAADLYPRDLDDLGFAPERFGMPVSPAVWPPMPAPSPTG